MTRRISNAVVVVGALMMGWTAVHAQEPFHEPQVRYLIADMQMGGSPDYYRKWATQEHDPDSAKAVKEWDAGTRVLDIGRFERKQVQFQRGKNMRIVHKGTNRTVPGDEIRLTTDLNYDAGRVRCILADLTLGAPADEYRARAGDPDVAEALSRWGDHVRAVNLDAFEVRGQGKDRRIIVKGANKPINGSVVVLNSDSSFPEERVRYVLADIVLGGVADFYREIFDKTHDPISGEAVVRFETGYRITNLDILERKRVNGSTLIVYKGTEKRINGMDVKLSSDPQ